MDVLPSDLATYGRDAKALLKELQSQNERMFLVTFLVLNTGKTEQELETNVFQAVSIAQKHNCELCRLDFQQATGRLLFAEWVEGHGRRAVFEAPHTVAAVIAGRGLRFPIKDAFDRSSHHTGDEIAA